MTPHTFQALELADALERVARDCASELGAEAVRALRPSADPVGIAAELGVVAEMMALTSREEHWSVPAAPDVREAFGRLRIEGSVLDPETMRKLATLLEASRAVRRSLIDGAAVRPRLAGEAEPLADLPQLVAELDRVVDVDGQIRDDASPELLRLRREIGGARARIVSRLERFARELPSHLRVPDASVTVRDSRYVVPVRREARGEVGGIVHDESGSGATLFVEPPVAIQMMNRLREIETAIAREIQRILRALTDRLRPFHEDLSRSLEALVRLDTIQARARYAIGFDGHPPEMLAAGTEEYVVVQGRHPLLLAGSRAVVPFDLMMDPGERTLVISGPNTGGKTVLLKASGLISLLAQSGVVPPVGPGTRLPVFTEIFADIGDEQSIEASLSTFAAHLKNLREPLDRAGPASLVLIDEIGSGTDPLEGAALARAVLLELARRRVFTVATTHLGQLKLLPAEDSRVVNASLRFDAEQLEPTYELRKGVPGRSYGLAIAARLGVPESVLAEAEAALPTGERDLSKLLTELEAREQHLTELGARLEADRARVERLGSSLSARQRDLGIRERSAERRARDHARELLLEARREVESAIRDVRAAGEAGDLETASREARRRIENAARRQADEAPRTERPPAPVPGNDLPLEPGVRVRIQSLGRTGSLLELRDEKAMVETGGLRLLLPRADLVALPEGDQPIAHARPRYSGGAAHAAVAVEASHEVDLRGLRVEDLDLRLGRALDAAAVASLPSLRIIHGKGTGALRARVRELLDADPRIISQRAGDRTEGGTGVTVAELA